MRLPAPRGPISEALIRYLGAPGGPLALGPGVADDPLLSDDVQLALFVCFELHYRGFEEVSDDREWDPEVIGFRNGLVAAFEAALENKVGRREIAPDEVEDRLRAIAASEEGPSLSRYLERDATLDEFREFVAHRSIYHLREADPHTWVVPRLSGRAKAALVEIQTDEYGDGIYERMHSRLFEELMSSLDLDPAYGAFVGRVPGTTLATLNLMSVFGLSRRWRGAAAGHLALLEMDSSVPNRRYADGLRRLGRADATRFYDEHVEADSVHEAIAAHDLAGGLARQEPELASDIVFGAEALALIEGYFARTLLGAWQQGTTSLLPRP